MWTRFTRLGAATALLIFAFQSSLVAAKANVVASNLTEVDFSVDNVQCTQLSFSIELDGDQFRQGYHLQVFIENQDDTSTAVTDIPIGLNGASGIDQAYANYSYSIQQDLSKIGGKQWLVIAGLLNSNLDILEGATTSQYVNNACKKSTPIGAVVGGIVGGVVVLILLLVACCCLRRRRRRQAVAREAGSLSSSTTSTGAGRPGSQPYLEKGYDSQQVTMPPMATLAHGKSSNRMPQSNSTMANNAAPMLYPTEMQAQAAPPRAQRARTSQPNPVLKSQQYQPADPAPNYSSPPTSPALRANNPLLNSHAFRAAE